MGGRGMRKNNNNKNFPQEIIDKKYITTDSGQKIYAQGGKEKKISTLHVQKKTLTPLKIPSPPHPSPSLF